MYLFGLHSLGGKEQCKENCHDTCVSSTVTSERKRMNCKVMRRRLKVEKKVEREKEVKASKPLFFFASSICSSSSPIRHQHNGKDVSTRSTCLFRLEITLCFVFLVFRYNRIDPSTCYFSELSTLNRDKQCLFTSNLFACLVFSFSSETKESQLCLKETSVNTAREGMNDSNRMVKG